MNLAVKILDDKEKWVRCITNKFGLSRGKADDYLSECILKLLERGEVTIMENGNRNGYIYVLIRNLIISKHIRKKEPDIIYSDDLRKYDKQAQYQNQDCSYKEIRDKIYDLKYIYKECLILKFRFGLNQHEIARLLNISRGTIGPRIMRGQAKLKQIYLN